MARRGIGEGIIGLTQGLIEGYKTGKTLQDMAAERELKKKQFQLDVEKAAAGYTYVDPKIGQVITSSGLPQGARERIGLPAATGPQPTNSGKLQIGKPANTPVKEINVPQATYDANPELFQEAPEGHKYKIIPTAKPVRSPEDLADINTLRLANQSLAKDGKIPEALQPQVSSALKRIKPDLLTEEDQGMFYGIQKMLGGDKAFTIKSNTSSKTITPDIAKQYLAKAGGDKAKARALAAADGYQF